MTHQMKPFRRVAEGADPPYLAPAYRSTVSRAPHAAPVSIPQTITELAGPCFTPDRFPPTEDLSVLDGREALGERIIVTGRLLDEDARPVPNSLIEIWQANAAGRYAHSGDAHDAPLDPNFRGSGRVYTDAAGAYRFVTIKPGAYPWGNHHNAWRPNHIHFSLFGPGFATRLITQMYFPGDPLLPLDPIFNAVPAADARNRLIADFDIGVTESDHALGYRFDIVLRGRAATPMEG